MVDHSDPLTAEAAWLTLLHTIGDCNEGMQISLYQRFAAEYPSYTGLCQEKIRQLAAQLIEASEE